MSLEVLWRSDCLPIERGAADGRVSAIIMIVTAILTFSVQPRLRQVTTVHGRADPKISQRHPIICQPGQCFATKGTIIFPTRLEYNTDPWQGQPDEARKFFAVSLDRIQDESLQQFATCKMISSFARLGQLQHIAHLFEPTLKWLKKNENKNYVLLAELLSDIGQFSEAIKYADLAIESLLTSTDTPSLDRGQGYRVKAAVYEANHDVEAAIENYERVLEINPHEQQSMEHLARLYIRQSRADDALKLINQVLVKRPNDQKFSELKREAQNLK